MPPISRTRVAPVLKAKDYARSWDRRRAEPAVTCHNSSLYMGVKLVRVVNRNGTVDQVEEPIDTKRLTTNEGSIPSTSTKVY